MTTLKLSKKIFYLFLFLYFVLGIYLSLNVGSADVALSLANHATANGKNLYYKLTGTLTANRTVTMPDSAERVFIVEDGTTRTSSNYSMNFIIFLY